MSTPFWNIPGYAEEVEHMLNPGKRENERLSREIVRLCSLLSEAHTTMRHAQVFIASRETMNPVGRELYSEVLDKLEEFKDEAGTV